MAIDWVEGMMVDEFGQAGNAASFNVKQAVPGPVLKDDVLVDSTRSAIRDSGHAYGDRELPRQFR